MNLIRYLKLQIGWSERTFGSGARHAALCAHIRKELDEIAAKPHDLEEWVDVMILAFDGAWRAGHSADMIATMLEYKQMKNFNRTFIISADPTQPSEHDRTKEDPC